MLYYPMATEPWLTPEERISKLALEWIEEFENYLK